LLGEYDYLTSLFFPPAVTRQLDAIGLDIVHFHTPGQVGLLGAYYARHNNIPLITTYHTDLFEYVRHYPGVFPGILALTMMTPLITGGGMNDFRVGLSLGRPERSLNRWNQKIVQRGMTLIHNHCDLVIAPSTKIEKQLISWHTEAPLTVLQTGIDELFTTNSEIKSSAAQYGIGPDDEVILSVGRVGTEKNLDLLIRAFALVSAKRPDARLMIVGDGPAREGLIAQAKAAGLEGKVVFTGPLDSSKLGSI
jgi:1,2-diacylglycerol 3-alpha-glucosyltransferase